MGKHSYDDLGPREIMSCTRVYPDGIGLDNNGKPVGTITIIGDVHADNNLFVTDRVPSRPTGAHRIESADPRIAVILYNPNFWDTPRGEDLPVL